MTNLKILITSIDPNRQKLDGGAMFGNAPRAVWKKWYTPDEEGRILLACRVLLIEIHGKKILLETGIGSSMEPKLANRFGITPPDKALLPNLLEKAGTTVHNIDYVILSHLHFDHAGGLLPSYKEIQNGNDQLLFPNAKYIVGETAYNRALFPHVRDRASFVQDINTKLKDTGRLVIVKNSKCPELEAVFGSKISFLESNGHTPGQLHTIVHGAHHTLIFCGDLIPGTHWVHLPITMGYDRYPEKLIDEKKDLLETVNKNEWILFFTHDAHNSGAQIQLNENSRYSTKKLYPFFDSFEL
ncbi:MBL fold metallo-hydrolase [Bacteriovoracaceae bacterium]|nr:MBL fold metallo-hydrolase [Bacteriovoracaceae bacterium]